MNEATLRLSLPLIAAGQSQKHVTHNEALVALDGLVQLSVIGTRESPPTAPVTGDRYIVDAAATGVFAGRQDAIALFEDGTWQFITPQRGWRAWSAARGSMLVYTGTDWTDLKVRAADTFGINAAADAQNRLVVAGPGSLFTHEGTDCQAKINKASPAATASLMFQTGFSSRAEIGLTGSDDLAVRVSADGASFRDVMVANRSTGEVRLPGGMVDGVTGQRALALLAAPQKDIWRSDMDSPATPRTYTIASVAGAAVTITTNSVEQFYNTGMRNAAMVRIWNTSKTPARAAWVNWNNAANVFNVSDAAQIAGWLAGETLRVGDPNPTGSNVSQMVALDISNYLFNQFGAVFRQRGLKLSLGVQGTGGRVSLACSGTGALDSAFSAFSSSDGSRHGSFADIFTTELSPVSSSNLLFVQETLSGGTAMAASRSLRIVGVWV